MPRSLLQGLLVGSCAAIIAGLLGWSGIFTTFEHATWSWRAAFHAQGPQAKQPIVLIALDQQSLDWGREENDLSWPWPREAYNLVLAFCQRAGAKAVAFDVLFSEPSLYGVEDDLAFAEALRTTRASVGSLALGSGSGTVIWPEDSRNLPRWYDESNGRLPTLREVSAASLPTPEIAEAFDRIGNVSASPDKDGVFRRSALLGRYQDRPVAGLPLAMMIASSPQLQVQRAPHGLTIGEHFVPTDHRSRAILNFRGPSGTFPTYSAAAIIQSELLLQENESPVIDPAEIKDAYVIFGFSAPGLYDLRPTPLDGVFPGMEIHATVLDNLLSDDFMTPTATSFNTLVLFGLAILTGAGICRCRSLGQTLGCAVTALPLPILAGYASYPMQLWMPVATPLAGVTLALIGGISLNYVTEGRKKRQIRQAFNQYLHPTVIEQLVEHPERLQLGGEKRELSMFFSDLQGFTGLSERLDPEALTALLNDYLSEMSDIILDAGGTIDKYEGDAIIAFWNAPLEQTDHAARAVRAALACQQRLNELRASYIERTGIELHMRIGINSGPAVVGNMGSSRRFDYTMLGDAVNLAARLEGVNKVFGTSTLISHSTREKIVPEIPVRKIATVAVAGRTEPVTIYEPLIGTPPAEQRAVFEEYEKALEHFGQGAFEEALVIFERLTANDKPALAFANCCRELIASPPAEWNGTWVLENK